MRGGTSSAHTAASSVQARSAQSRRRSRRPKQSISSSSRPSSGLLALVATIASSSPSVDARPLESPPLTFLYPFIDEHETERLIRPTRTVSPPSAPFPTPTRHQLSRRDVSLADKYAPGTDGLWRKMSEYTLYGSTIRSVPTSMTVEDAAASTPQSTSTSSSRATETPSTTSSLDDLYDSLPYGWQPSSDSNRPSTIIVGLSVTLACLIIIVIGVSAYWRRCRKIARTKDPEKKIRQKDDGEDDPIEDEDPLDAQHIQSQKKMWVKATARWKANARHSFRRRRGRRVAQKYSESPRSSRRDLRDATSVSRPRSRSPSMTSSSNLAASCYPNTEPLSTHSRTSTSLPEQRLESPPPERSTTPPASPPFPPAYHCSSRKRLLQTSGVVGSLHLQIPQSPFLDPDSQSPPPFSGTDDEDGQLPPRSVVAHVATDDKAVLARMAAMSSAPPDTDDPGGTSSDPRPSVPSWYEESYDYSRPSYDYVSASSSSPESRVPTAMELEAFTSNLPPPPTKAELAASMFYDYPASFEEDLDDSEPSAPPFEECIGVPSAPPLEPEEPPSSASLSQDLDEVSNAPIGVDADLIASAPFSEGPEGESSTAELWFTSDIGTPASES